MYVSIVYDDDRNVVKVFSSPELARKYFEFSNFKGSWESREVEDDFKPEFIVCMYRNGDVLTVRVEEREDDPLIQLFTRWDEAVYMITYVEALTNEEAITRANERRIALIEAGVWEE